MDALSALGMRVLTCPKKLVLHVDSLMLNPTTGSAEERILSEWWAHAAPANGQIRYLLVCCDVSSSLVRAAGCLCLFLS